MKYMKIKKQKGEFMLKKNDIIELYIDGSGYEGEGVGRIDGMPVFVPYAAKGDTARVKIVKVAKTHAFGRLEQVLKPSDIRCDVPCPAFGKCGGCSIMHLSYEAQLELKKERVADCMKKIGRLDVKVLPTIPSEKQFRYRNKVQLPVGQTEEGEPFTGFYANHSHRIVRNERCLLQSERSDGVVDAFLEWMKENGVSAYNEESGKGLVRHLFIRQGENKNGETELLAMPVINGKNLPAEEILAETMKKAGVTCLCVNINRAKTNVILGDETRVVFGSGYVEDVLCENTFKISPESFYQVNRPQAEKLYGIALDMADISKDDVVYDLYCGAGTITLCAAKRAGMVYGIEIVPEAVENAKENAKLNGIENVEFLCGDVAETVRELKKRAKPRVVIVDPPRKGCDTASLDLLLELSPEKIAYISCNPATLARDMAYLCERGYTHGDVQPVDLFPNTSHVECCVLICRK